MLILLYNFVFILAYFFILFSVVFVFLTIGEIQLNILQTAWRHAAWRHTGTRARGVRLSEVKTLKTQFLGRAQRGSQVVGSPI